MRRRMIGQVMAPKADVSVIIPTYSRGRAVLGVLEKIGQCDPAPRAIIVHIDQSDGILEGELKTSFPGVTVLSSDARLGPGGGRHKCLEVCRTPYAVSFDDDSYPVDSDFFRCVEQHFARDKKAAIFGAAIWHRHEAERLRTRTVRPAASYIGCGFAIRLAAYRQTRGLLPRPIAYGMEESDLCVQLFASGWGIYEAGDLRVFHDTDLAHHQSKEINAGTIANVGLFAFLHYPASRLGWGLLSVLNRVVYSISVGRLRGILSGVLMVPAECYRHRHYRRVIPWPVLSKFLEARRGQGL